MLRLTLPLLVAFSLASPANAQFDDPPLIKSKLPKKFAERADVRVEVFPAKVKPGDTITIRLTIDLKPAAMAVTYPFFPKDPAQDSRNKFALNHPELTLLPGDVDPPGAKKKQRADAPGGVFDEYYDTTQTWEFKARVSPEATGGPKDIDLGKINLQVCTDSCVYAKAADLPHLEFTVDAPAGTGVKPPTPAPPRSVGTDPPSVPVAGVSKSTEGPKVPKPVDVYAAEMEAIRQSVVKDESVGGTAGKATGEAGLGAFVATAALWGLISLVTPCVFPMIPITVSIFLKHAHGSRWERMKLAGVYCLTIIVVLGVSAFALLKFMAWLSAHPVTNVLLGVLFLVLALSLFGMYELTLPNFMARRLQAKQSKGGVVGTIFGALAFTVISFTCVAPFLGGFAGISAADSGGGSLIAVPTPKEILGGLAFATAFAAPFFILAMVPGLLKSLPKSGGWLDSVKVVMGFLELAAALKFFRTAEIRVSSPSEIFTYDMVLAGWVAISFACALYLFNAYRLPHDEEKPNIGVPRLLFAVAFLGLGFYLLPAIFKGSDDKAQRPAGAVYSWVQAFLLPEDEAGAELTDLKAAIERARKSQKPVFLDFTGVTCTNCKYNEKTVFSLPSVRTQLEKFERVQLYTDEIPAEAYSVATVRELRELEAESNRQFQIGTFGDAALPLYAVLVPLPDGKVKLVNGTFDGNPNTPFAGKINSPDKFAAWLKEALEKAKK